MFDYLIQGNGFKAIYLALSLRKKFKDKTIAIKFAGPFGGIYNSISLDNFFLDLAIQYARSRMETLLTGGHKSHPCFI